jgi:hypothetical protein
MTNEQIARVVHEVNRAYCLVLGDASQLPWEDAPDCLRHSVMIGVAFLRANPDAGPASCHKKWLREKEANGWKFGPVKDFDKKEHPYFMPYDELSTEDKAKDSIFHSIVRALDCN